MVILIHMRHRKREHPLDLQRIAYTHIVDGGHVITKCTPCAPTQWCICPFLLLIFKNWDVELLMNCSAKWVNHYFRSLFYNFRTSMVSSFYAVRSKHFITQMVRLASFLHYCTEISNLLLLVPYWVSSNILQKNRSAFILRLNGNLWISGSSWFIIWDTPLSLEL
jgi:hypothetical protein